MWQPRSKTHGCHGYIYQAGSYMMSSLESGASLYQIKALAESQPKVGGNKDLASDSCH